MSTLAPSLEARLRAADHPALADWFSEHREELKRFVATRMDRRLTPRLDASDIVQQAYLDADVRLPHFGNQPAETTFETWMRQVTLQTLIDLHRRHVAAQRRSVTRETRLDRQRNHGDDSNRPGWSGVAGDVSSPSQVVNRDERRQRLRLAIRQLNERDQEILALRHDEQLSNGEVASRLGLSVSAASNRYVRALERLAHVLSEMESSAV